MTLKHLLVTAATTMLVVAVLSGCAASKVITFPAADDVFVTTGDGDILKPYTPLGQILYVARGTRLSFIPILGLIPLGDPDPETIIRKEIVPKAKKMGGDAVINLTIFWVPGTGGILGYMATGPYVYISGTVIKR